jgi:hypothetical protein
MNRLSSDPTLELCPNFASVDFHASRAPLLSPTVDDAQAAVTLHTIWTASNATLRVQWQRQLDADLALLTEQQRLATEATERQRQVLELEESAILAEERKKNRLKHIPIPQRPRPPRTTADVLVNEFALRKLDRGQYVELYYWTNKGLEDARLNYRTLDDESMVPTTGHDGSTTWIMASAARPASGVIPDHSLTPMDFAHAVPRAIASLEKRGWDANRVKMLASFWGGLMFHRYWSSSSPLEQRALLTYQDEQRRAWHQAIPLTDGTWDISILDQGEISEILDRLYREDRQRRDHDMGMHKSLFSLNSH